MTKYSFPPQVNSCKQLSGDSSYVSTFDPVTHDYTLYQGSPQHVILNLNVFPGGIMILKETRNNPKQYYFEVIQSFDVSNNIQLPGKPSSFIHFNNTFFICVEVLTETGGSHLHQLLVYEKIKQQILKKACVEFDQKIQSIWSISSKLYLQTEQSFLFEIDGLQFNFVTERVKIDQLEKNVYVGVKKIQAIFNFILKDQFKMLAVIDTQQKIYFFCQGKPSHFEEYDVLLKVNLTGQFTLLNFDRGHFVLSQQAQNTVKNYLLKINGNLSLSIVGTWKLPPFTEQVQVCVENGVINVLQRLNKIYSVVRVSTLPSLLQLPRETLDQSEFICQQPALLISDAVKQPQFTIFQNLLTVLCQKTDDVQNVRLQAIIQQINNYVSAFLIDQNQKKWLQEEIKNLERQLYQIRVQLESLLMRGKEILFGTHSNATIHSIVQLKRELQRVSRLQAMIGKGYAAIIEWDLVQRCREYYSDVVGYQPTQSLKMLKEIMYRINDGDKLVSLLPFTAFEMFSQLLNQDMSQMLEASFCIIQYHLILAQEVALIQNVETRLMSDEMSTAVQSIRDFDHFSIQQNKSRELNRCLHKVLNVSLEIVPPHRILSILVEIKDFETAMYLINRFDAVIKILSETSFKADFISKTIQIFFELKIAEDWLPYISQFELQIQKSDIYVNQIKCFVDKIIATNQFERMLQREMSEFQEQTIQTYLVSQHVDMAIVKLLWQKKTNKAIGLAIVYEMEGASSSQLSTFKNACVDNFRRILSNEEILECINEINDQNQPKQQQIEQAKSCKIEKVYLHDYFFEKHECRSQDEEIRELFQNQLQLN